MPESYTGGISLFSNGSGSTGNLQIETGTLRVQNTAPRGAITRSGRSHSLILLSLQNWQFQLSLAKPLPLGEAQGIVKTADGEIMLVASAPQAIPSVPTTSVVCPGFQPK